MAIARYQSIIESLVANGRPFVASVETGTAVQVERGAALAGGASVRLPEVCPDVVDASGHDRPVYRPLLIYAHALIEAEGVSPWLATLDRPGTIELTAVNGSVVAAASWSSLALTVGDAGRGDWFSHLIDGQQASGALMRAAPSDNPETHWYHELVTLHALTNHALRTGSANEWAAVERATMFHLNETEPDHATGQPWGLPAFVRVAGAEPLADALLHAVSAHQPGGPSGVALLLLADTLYGLRNAPRRGAPENASR